MWHDSFIMAQYFILKGYDSKQNQIFATYHEKQTQNNPDLNGSLYRTAPTKES